jgi:hypothetical protein
MKFHVSIECESIGEFNWLAKQLGRETVAAVAPAAEPPDELDEAGLRPNGETAPATAAKGSRGRPKKEAKAAAAVAPAQAPEQPAATAAASQNIPELADLKSTITAAARKAMKKEGPTTILDLLPAFRDATGLDFVMNATEDHRMALYELAVAAGIVAEMPL